MSDELQDFEQFMQQRRSVGQAYVNGNAEPLREIATHVSPATFFGPAGDAVQGADAVFESQERGAGHFESGESTFEILHMGARDGFAYWVGFQRATTYLKGKAEAVPFNLRITEVFRREDGAWKLIHRHADELKSETD